MGICFYRKKEWSSCISGELIFAVESVLTILDICKNPVFGYIEILSWLKAKNINILVLEIFNIFSSAKNIKNFTRINFSGSAHFEYFLKTIFYYF